MVSLQRAKSTEHQLGALESAVGEEGRAGSVSFTPSVLVTSTTGRWHTPSRGSYGQPVLPGWPMEGGFSQGGTGGDEQGFLWDGEQAGCPRTLPEGGSLGAKGERLELEWKQHCAAFLREPPWTFPLRARRRLWWPCGSAVEPPTSSRKMLSRPAAWPQETQRGRLSRTRTGEPPAAPR